MSTWKEAADRLTIAVWENCRYSNLFFHHFEGWQDTEIGRESTEETFHLKHFLEHGQTKGKYEGNCNALTNFLCCLMTSVGVNAIVQRTNRIVLESGKKVGRWSFVTRPIWPAGRPDLRGAQMQWGWHQVVLVGERVWDGNLIFVLAETVLFPVDMQREVTPPEGVEFGSRAHWEWEIKEKCQGAKCDIYFHHIVDFAHKDTWSDYRWETNHSNTKLSPPKLKVTTAPWENDGCL